MMTKMVPFIVPDFIMSTGPALSDWVSRVSGPWNQAHGDSKRSRLKHIAPQSSDPNDRQQGQHSSLE